MVVLLLELREFPQVVVLLLELPESPQMVVLLLELANAVVLLLEPHQTVLPQEDRDGLLV